jgi:hypothetical protein
MFPEKTTCPSFFASGFFRYFNSKTLRSKAISWIEANHDKRTTWEAWFHSVKVRMTELTEVARRMTGKLVKSNPTCLARTSRDSDPIGRSDMGCQREQRTKRPIPMQPDRGLGKKTPKES